LQGSGGRPAPFGDRAPARPDQRELRQLARRQPGCRALTAHYGIGELTAPVILCEPGDVSRLRASRKAVRCAALDAGVHRSDRRSRAGRLAKQGSPLQAREEVRGWAATRAPATRAASGSAG
jgi:hypothetical protein